MEIKETILYMKDNTGSIREWAISCSGNEILIRHGQLGGAMQYQTEVVEEGKATRSLEEQIMSRMASRISKQRDKGYTNMLDVAESRSHAVNQLGLLKPMLAQKIERVKNIDYRSAVAQPKFDGNRCLIHCKNGKNFAYSRNGKLVPAIGHILEDIKLEEGMTVDGELYCHGQSLQTIVSWIKREQADTLKLKYHLYDIASNLPYTGRSSIIKGIPHGPSISPVYGDPVDSYDDLIRLFRVYRDNDYEGAILRWGNSGYEDGKRSKSLVKVKEWFDDEFKVTNVVPSREGWARLECLANNGEVFYVSAPGTVDEKYRVMINKEKYIGKMVTVEYAQLTKDGIPFHPVAIDFRYDL